MLLLTVDGIRIDRSGLFGVQHALDGVSLTPSRQRIDIGCPGWRQLEIGAPGRPVEKADCKLLCNLAHRNGQIAPLHLDVKRRAQGYQITDWLLWFAAKAIEAQRRTLRQVEFVLAKARVMHGLRGKLNDRQERALLRMFAAGPDGFAGGLSAANYMTITGAPTATTTRDLAALVGLGALLRTGEQKGTRYWLPIAVAPIEPLEITDLA